MVAKSIFYMQSVVVDISNIYHKRQEKGKGDFKRFLGYYLKIVLGLVWKFLTPNAKKVTQNPQKNK